MTSLEALYVRFPLLNDTNYSEWSMRMEAVLVKRKLWKVVKPSLVPPEDVKDVDGWMKKMLAARDADSMAEARAEIMERVESSQLAHVRDPDPMVIWMSLEQVHVARGFATRLSLRREFLRLSKGADETMTSWIGRMKTLAFRLEDVGIKVDDEDRILALTNGLDSTYEAFVISLDGTPPADMTLSYVIDCLLNEEIRRKNGSSGRGVEGALYAAGGMNRGAPRLGNQSTGGGSKCCRHCGKPYDDGIQPSGPPTCWQCGQVGHTRPYCTTEPTKKARDAANIAVERPTDIIDGGFSLELYPPHII